MKPFVTDGCSGFLSFFWRTVFRKPPPWEGCCVEHDRAYWQGGDLGLRLKADSKVMQCVAANGHPWWAAIMFIAVRICGVYWLPFPSLRKVHGHWRLSFCETRFGYGFKYPFYNANQHRLRDLFSGLF